MVGKREGHWKETGQSSIHDSATSGLRGLAFPVFEHAFSFQNEANISSNTCILMYKVEENMSVEARD